MTLALFLLSVVSLSSPEMDAEFIHGWLGQFYLLSELMEEQAMLCF